MNLSNQITFGTTSGAATAPSEHSASATAIPSLLSQGTRFLESAQFEQAYESLSQALAETPDNADILILLGRLALATNMPDEAGLFFHEACVHTTDGLQKVHHFGHSLLSGGHLEARQIVLDAISKSAISTPANHSQETAPTLQPPSADCTTPLGSHESIRDESAFGEGEIFTRKTCSTDVAEVYSTCSEFDDGAWQQALLASVDSTILKGIQLPGFADETLQRNSVGSSGRQALHEGALFYGAIKKYIHQYAPALNPTSKILDFGCGWGRYIRYFLKDTLASHLYGVDVDPIMIDACKESFPYGNFHTVSPFPPTNLPDGHFDLIFAYSVFSHLSAAAADAWIVEFSRILAPSGMLVVTTQGREFILYCQQIRDSIRQTGKVEHPWHTCLAQAFVDNEACLNAYDLGEHLFAPTGGGETRPSSFYGEALVPRGHAERIWGQHLLFRDFLDDRNVLPQAMIIMQKVAQTEPVPQP